MLSSIQSVSFRLATEGDKHLDTYDNTKLVAANTCPTWGIITYQMHKRLDATGRALALEAGSAMHQVFAWVRLCSLFEQLRSDSLEFATEMFNSHGPRILGTALFTDVMSATQRRPGLEDIEDFCKESSINVLELGPYYDDPRDKRRTLTNMEECALAYIDRWKFDDTVWMRDRANPYSDIGIEIPFDLVCEITLDNTVKKFRLTGKIDGLHVNKRGEIVLGENKTASRLDDAWSMSFALATQITHYCIAASVFTESTVRRAVVHGITIPLPKSYDYGGIVREIVERKDYHIERWLYWVLHTVELYERWRDNPFNAPQYTHSCNRYFRPCSLIPFCDSPTDEQRIMVEDMTTVEWSPLHETME